MKTPQERLAWIREKLYGPRGKTAIAKDLGIVLQQYIRYEQDRVIPGELLLRLSQEKQVNPRWVLHGVGREFLPERPRREAILDAAELVVDLWEENDQLRRRISIRESEQKYEHTPVLAVIPAGMSPDAWAREQGHIQAEVRDCVAVPILGGRIAAGAPRDVYEHETEGWAIFYRRAIRNPKTTSALRVDGDSMEPFIPDGSLAGVDYSQRDPAKIVRGRFPFAAIRVDGGCVIRRVERADGHWLFLPSNPSATNRPAVWGPSEGENPIVGKVVTLSVVYE